MREALFNRLHDPGGIAFLRLADQKMNVIGHDDVAHGHKAIARADFFKHRQKQIATLLARQPGLPMVTTAGDEAQLFGAVVASGMVGHQASLLVVAKKKL